jgi:hypothetical protein
MSVVYYVPTDTDDLLISTMADRAKAHAVAWDGKVGRCVPGERWPFAFLQVYADAEIERERDLVVDVMMAVAERMSGDGDEARPFVDAMAEREDWVVIRCRPYATFASPPLHLDRNDQAQQITHWLSATVLWGAPDPR